MSAPRIQFPDRTSIYPMVRLTSGYDLSRRQYRIDYNVDGGVSGSIFGDTADEAWRFWDTVVRPQLYSYREAA